ncbi:MAG TPA: metalloregulator ArsR/SmtB family transcription factor [Vicinamibacterales bacterium]|jgi:DNA-binding transcriptional ArsR family regulator|nr:metalloregulator ArsR/SmtB family transcription factor [Vicinamibacterales bacterium]
MVTSSARHSDVVFRALADPTRRQILGLLRGGRRTVGEIASQFPTSRPAISRHLRLLRTAGLVVTSHHGAARLCDLNARPLRAIDEWLRDYERFWGGSLRSLKRYVESSR